MEVGHQPVDDAKAVARPDEKVGLAVAGHAATGLEGAQSGRADRHDSTAAATGGRDLGRRLGADPVAFGVHPVFVERFATHRQERSDADMEGNRATATPRSPRAANTAASKCNPAVGAATAPGSAA